jgi:hypothetical protein
LRELYASHSKDLVKAVNAEIALTYFPIQPVSLKGILVSLHKVDDILQNKIIFKFIIICKVL